MIKGKVISGEFGKIIIREKADTCIELGELLISQDDVNKPKILLQAYDLIYGSQLSQANLELISGMTLEEEANLEFMDPKLRNYRLALLKTLITIDQNNKASLCKTLPGFFSNIKEITQDDLQFFTTPKKPLYLGNLRSGSRVLDIPVYLDGEKVFSEHILITASTGKGKSNLTSCILWNCVDKDYCGILVLDPHDEYYGRNTHGLKNHPNREKIVYYTPQNPPPGTRTLKINVKDLKPEHLNGVTFLTDPQKDALAAYYKRFQKVWVHAILTEKDLPHTTSFHEGTIAVIKRKLIDLLDVEVISPSQPGGEPILAYTGVFDSVGGETTINDICRDLEESKTVILDTSHFNSNVEILVGSLITTQIFKKYKLYKIQGIENKPVISIIIEEAPRVLGKDVLQKGNNIFSTITREGRKFKVGLTAITQLPSLIPREILANMNTKIIMGIEMAPERKAIIESSSQDLSSDERSIASLDKGEAIVTSTFSRFATPVKIPMFKDLAVHNKIVTHKLVEAFNGVELS